jgi:membrane-associated phospholipid phosphatase
MSQELARTSASWGGDIITDFRFYFSHSQNNSLSMKMKLLVFFGLTVVVHAITCENRLRNTQKVNLSNKNYRLHSSVRLQYRNNNNDDDIEPKLSHAMPTEAESPISIKKEASFFHHDMIARQELKLMKCIQQLPGLRPLSLAVHYSLLPHVVTPALAMIAWLVSLPVAASLICFVCAQDMINTAIKWAVQRPRPLWYSHDTGLTTKHGTCSWEADFSFPSAHTQFFSGLAFCSCVLFGCNNLELGLGLACGFGSIVGITRNYLGVHWPTDTAFGLLLGGALGILWGRLDPYLWLLRQGSPLLSVGVATGLTASLALLLVLVRTLVGPVDDKTHACWCENVLSSLPPETQAMVEASSFMPCPRKLRTKIGVITTIWCTLAFTAFCPAHLPTAMAEPGGCIRYRLMQTMVGLAGMGGSGVVLKKAFVNHMPTLSVRKGFSWLQSMAVKTTLKGFAYAGICAWTFLLTQLLSHRLFGILA